MLAPAPRGAAGAASAVAVLLRGAGGALVRRVLCADGTCLDLAPGAAREAAPLELLPWGVAADAAVRAGTDAREPGAVERAEARDDRARRDRLLRGRAPPEPLRAAVPRPRGGEAPLGRRYGRRPAPPAAPPAPPAAPLRSYHDLPPAQLEALRAAAAAATAAAAEAAAQAAGRRTYKRPGVRPAQR